MRKVIDIYFSDRDGNSDSTQFDFNGDWNDAMEAWQLFCDENGLEFGSISGFDIYEIEDPAHVQGERPGRQRVHARHGDAKRIELPCKFGMLVCECVRDDEDYKEFAIDLYRNDGKVVQVCVVGTNEGELFLADWMKPEQRAEAARIHRMVHVNLWDGESEGCRGIHYVEPFGEGWWGEASA